MRIIEDELATRHRIRRAAVALFGRAGFDVGVREIAAAAGVSPGLIRHHFGSKDGLRRACDAWVKDEILAAALEQVESPNPTLTFLAQMGHLDLYRPLVDYVVQTLRAGGELAREIVDRMVEDSRVSLEAGVAAGTFHPSIDPALRARYLVMAGLGEILLGQILDGDGFASATSTGTARLEMYTQGLLTSPDLFDAYRARLAEPGDAGAVTKENE